MMNFKLSVLAFAVLVAFGCAFAPCAAEAEASGLLGGEENRADGSDNEKLGEEFTYIFFSYSLSWYDPRMPITIKQVDDKYILAVGDDGRRRDEGNQEKTFEIADEADRLGGRSPHDEPVERFAIGSALSKLVTAEHAVCLTRVAAPKQIEICIG